MLILICLRNSDRQEGSIKLTGGELGLLAETEKRATKAGADVVWAESVGDLGKMQGYDTVILIAHHSPMADAIEINGKYYPTRQCIEAIPTDFSGTLDLTSCYSASIIQQIKMRCPESHVIGVESATSLRLRLLLLQHCIDAMRQNASLSYLDALTEATNTLTDLAESTQPELSAEIRKQQAAPSSENRRKQMEANLFINKTDNEAERQQQTEHPLFFKNRHSSGANRPTYLGGETRSTVFAPKRAERGQTFLVQAFIHKDADKEEVVLTARAIDDEAEERNSKPLSFSLQQGDRIEIELTAMGKTGDFEIDEPLKQAIWAGMPTSVEFAVTVSESCSAKQMIGKLLIAINKEPAGGILFKTEIGAGASEECAPIIAMGFDKQQEANQEKQLLLSQLQQQRNTLLQAPDSEQKSIDLAMLDRCIDLLQQDMVDQQQPMLRVFISSTSDMQEYRQILKTQVEQCQMHAEMYENWMQGDKYPRDMCCQKVLESDIFVCIVGAKYGSIEPIWGKSMTEIEYRTAVMKGMPILLYFDQNAMPQMEPLQARFAEEIRLKRLVKIFDSGLSLSLQARLELSTVKANFKRQE